MSVVLRPLKRGLVNGARPDEVEGPDGAISGESAARGMVEHTMDDIIATDFSVVAKGEEKILEKGSEIRPFFSSAWVVPNPPEGSELLEEYYIKGTKVQLYHMGNETESLYHVLPFEYALPIEKIRLIYLTIKELRERHPSDVELNRQEQARAYIRNLNENIMIRLARRN